MDKFSMSELYKFLLIEEYPNLSSISSLFNTRDTFITLCLVCTGAVFFYILNTCSRRYSAERIQTDKLWAFTNYTVSTIHAFISSVWAIARYDMIYK